MKLPIGKCKRLNGMLKIQVNGKQKIPIGSSIKLRRQKMMTKIKNFIKKITDWIVSQYNKRVK